MLARMGGMLILPQDAHHLEVLVGDGAALGKGGTEGGKFLFHPTGTDPDNRASAGEIIEGGELLGQQERIAIWRDQDGGAQADALGDRTDPSQGSDGFIDGGAEALGKRRRIHDVIAHPNRVETEGLGPLGQREGSFA